MCTMVYDIATRLQPFIVARFGIDSITSLYNTSAMTNPINHARHFKREMKSPTIQLTPLSTLCSVSQKLKLFSKKYGFYTRFSKVRNKVSETARSLVRNLRN